MIKYFLIIASLSFIIFINCSENNVILDLKSFEWENRILVVGGNGSKYQNQFDNLEVNKNEYTERDMVVILINKDESKISYDGLNVLNKLDYDSTLSIRKRFNFDNFNLILIGKDGGVKYNNNEPVKINKIFEIIDKMPMRMQEIKERNLKMKIKDVRKSKIKLVEYLGEVEPAWTPGWYSQTSTIGGQDFTEIELENGDIGIGPGCDDIIIKDSKEYLIGKSPLDVIDHFKYLMYRTRNIPYNGLAGIDIALWDLRGKVQGKSISEILGRKKDNLVPYASFVILSDPDERAQMSKTMLNEGWKAIKVRLHHDNEDLDVLTIKKIQDTVGGNLDILVDANQAQSPYPWQAGVIWDLDRAKKNESKNARTWLLLARGAKAKV